MKKLTLEDFLPTDADVSQWYDLNIDPNDSTVSSSIYKFRLYMREYIAAKLEPKKHNIGGLEYTEKKRLL